MFRLFSRPFILCQSIQLERRDASWFFKYRTLKAKQGTDRRKISPVAKIFELLPGRLTNFVITTGFETALEDAGWSRYDDVA
jgi:hypothetical protein